MSNPLDNVTGGWGLVLSDRCDCGVTEHTETLQVMHDNDWYVEQWYVCPDCGHRRVHGRGHAQRQPEEINR